MTRMIARILFEQWDPLGVGDVAPTDEYEDYARVIEAMLGRGEDGGHIRAYLNRMRVEVLLVPDDRPADDRAARAIIAASRN